MSYAEELLDLTGRVALVTGGSRGLGREMVRALARCGADVVITSRKLDSCEELAKEIEDTTGRAALPYACHVGRWDELDGLADAAAPARHDGDPSGHVDGDGHGPATARSATRCARGGTRRRRAASRSISRA